MPAGNLHQYAGLARRNLANSMMDSYEDAAKLSSGLLSQLSQYPERHGCIGLIREPLQPAVQSVCFHARAPEKHAFAAGRMSQRLNRRELNRPIKQLNIKRCDRPRHSIIVSKS